jgi:hypothetical protein
MLTIRNIVTHSALKSYWEEHALKPFRVDHPSRDGSISFVETGREVTAGTRRPNALLRGSRLDRRQERSLQSENVKR